MSIEQFKPGWLKTVLHDAVLSVRAGYDRHVAIHVGSNNDPFPLSWEDAEDLATRMNERFKSWTGRTLEEHFAARPPR